MAIPADHPPASQQHARSADDEIDLRELMFSLWTSKWLIGSITIIAAIVAAAYAYLTPPVYQSSVMTLPPPASSLASYNSGSQLQHSANLPELTPEMAYHTFLRHLTSDSIRLAFFNDTYLPAHAGNASESQRDAAWRRMSEELTVTPPKQGMDVATLTVEGHSPDVVAEWANQYVQKAIATARQELIGNLGSAVEVARQVNAEQMNALRSVATTIREAQLARLLDALQVAESISLEDPPTTGNLISSFTGETAYLRGARAIRAEIERLQQRDSDDPYIEELPGLLKQEALLASINLNPESLAVATIDRTALVPQDPIKPRKLLILALGIVLGGMLGVFAALARNLCRRQQRAA